jgi:hypothetical protein
MEATPHAEAAPNQVAQRETSLRQPWPMRGLWAACAVIALSLLAFGATRWMDGGGATSGSYYTVTTPAAHPPGEVIRAVFTPTITLVELQAILDEAQLRIISGPTEAGVYSLASASSRPVDESLSILRSHDSVRFAEPTGYLHEPPR